MRRLYTSSAQFICLLVAFVPLSFAQSGDASLFSGANANAQAPRTLTFQDALKLAQENDPAMRAAIIDAASADEDRKQARAALYPSLSGRSEYLGTEGDGKLPQGRFVTNDGVHVYREWAVVHQDFSPGVFSRVTVQRATVAQAIAKAKLEIARRGLAAAVTKNY